MDCFKPFRGGRGLGVEVWVGGRWLKLRNCELGLGRLNKLVEDFSSWVGGWLTLDI